MNVVIVLVGMARICSMLMMNVGEKNVCDDGVVMR